MAAAETPAERVCAALRTAGHEPHRRGAGWSCTCPAHDDRNPSLSVATGRDGRALLCCHAGCEAVDVLAAIGLGLNDLFAEGGRHSGLDCGRTRSPRAGKMPTTGAPSFATACEAVANLERSRGRRSAVWTYHDVAGEPCGLVVRWDRDGGGKDIRPVARVDGRWRSGAIPEPRPLYGLATLIASAPGSVVVVAEGEKAADAARSCGLVATTSAGGSKAAAKSDWNPLSDRQVWILPDHDEAGEAYAAEVARQANGVGARSVRVLRLADRWGLRAGDDLADVLAIAEGDADGVRATIEELAAAEVEEPESVGPPLDRFESFPLDVLPEPMQSYVRQSSAAIGCDPTFVALPLMSGIAAAIGNARRLEIKPEWSEPAIVWTAVVAESGTAKSPAMELALRPLRRLQDRAFAEHTAKLTEWEAAYARWEVANAVWKRSAAAAVNAGGDAGDPPAEPTRPACGRMIAGDVTTEAIVRLLQENPRGILIAHDELSAWLGSFDRYSGGKGGGDSGRWLELFGGRALVVDRKGSGTEYVPRACVSITGGIQPGILAQAVGREHRESGLLARLLVAKPPRRPKRWSDATVDTAVADAMQRIFERLLGLMPEEVGDEWEPLLVRLTPAARTTLVRFVNEHGELTASLTGDEAAASAKLEGYAARFALLFHLVRVANLDAAHGPDLADEASVEAGIRLARWFGREALRVYAALDGDEDELERGRLLEWVEGRGGAATVRDLATSGPRRFRGRRDKAEAVLADLVEAGLGRWVTEAPGPRGGRPSRRFCLTHVGHGGGIETPADAPAMGGFDSASSTASLTEPRIMP